MILNKYQQLYKPMILLLFIVPNNRGPVLSLSPLLFRVNQLFRQQTNFRVFSVNHGGVHGKNASTRI